LLSCLVDVISRSAQKRRFIQGVRSRVAASVVIISVVQLRGMRIVCIMGDASNDSGENIREHDWTESGGSIPHIRCGYSASCLSYVADVSKDATESTTWPRTPLSWRISACCAG